MKVQSKAAAQFCALDDCTAGEGLAIFFSQGLTDVTRWKFEVYAHLDTGQDLLCGSFFVSPPNATNPVGAPTRQVGAAVCPGAQSWQVIVSAAAGSQSAEQESADITLTSSKCCTAPVGVSRVGERHGYLAGGISASFNLFPGRTVTRISATGTPGGSMQFNGGDIINVPAGLTVVLEPKAPMLLGPLLTFTNVTWLVEYLESA